MTQFNARHSTNKKLSDRQRLANQTGGRAYWSMGGIDMTLVVG